MNTRPPGQARLRRGQKHSFRFRSLAVADEDHEPLCLRPIRKRCSLPNSDREEGAGIVRTSHGRAERGQEVVERLVIARRRGNRIRRPREEEEADLIALQAADQLTGNLEPAGEACRGGVERLHRGGHIDCQDDAPGRGRRRCIGRPLWVRASCSGGERREREKEDPLESQAVQISTRETLGSTLAAQVSREPPSPDRVACKTEYGDRCNGEPDEEYGGVQENHGRSPHRLPLRPASSAIKKSPARRSTLPSGARSSTATSSSTGASISLISA